MLAPQAHGKGLELMAWIDADVPALVSGDRGRLRQVLTNLLANAVKFTESRRGRRARARPERRPRVRFDVTDTGIGISRERARHALRVVRAGRHLDDAPLRRHRPRPGDLAPARRADGRRDRRRQRRRARAARSGSPPRLAEPAMPRRRGAPRTAAGRACGCSSSTTTRPTARSSTAYLRVAAACTRERRVRRRRGARR